jgi:polysaccharide export outer membrane protein
MYRDQNMTRRAAVAIATGFVLSTFGIVAAQEQRAGFAQKLPAVKAAAPAEYVIGAQDGLSINVWREPELSGSVVVRPDGKISLPLVNEIQAAGLTARQLQDQIAERLREFVAAPVVTVMVTAVKSQQVLIMGRVAKPGPYGLTWPMTVLDLIGSAGGFAEFAKTKSIRILRKDGTKQSSYTFNYNDYIRGKNPHTNIVLKNGDVVIVR